MSNAGKAQELKGINSRLARARADLKCNEEEQELLRSNATRIIGSIVHLDRELDRLTDKEPIVSEHAILRYLDRVIGLDLDDVRNSILSDDVKAFIKYNDKGKCPLPERGRAVIRGNVVVTVEA